MGQPVIHHQVRLISLEDERIVEIGLLFLKIFFDLHLLGLFLIRILMLITCHAVLKGK